MRARNWTRWLATGALLLATYVIFSAVGCGGGGGGGGGAALWDSALWDNANWV